jgi:hypothetical protein
VDAQVVSAPLDQGIAVQFGRRSVQAEFVRCGFPQLPWQPFGVRQRGAERDVLRRQHGAEAKQGRGGRPLPLDPSEGGLPGREHRSQVVPGHPFLQELRQPRAQEPRVAVQATACVLLT